MRNLFFALWRIIHLCGGIYRSRSAMLFLLTVKMVYCDIAGQTNERAMMGAIIPGGVVCGNKVPTVIFPNDTPGDRIYLWVGIVNSVAFDWLIRRIISTTVNYFLLLSVPIPQIEIDSSQAKTSISCTKLRSCVTDEYCRTNEMRDLRIRIEVAVAKACGFSLADIRFLFG